MTSPDPGTPKSDADAPVPPAGSVPVAPEPAAGPVAREPGAGTRTAGGAAARSRGALAGPVLPEKGSEDTDIAWGEYPERPDDRLYRDRPPHWADF